MAGDGVEGVREVDLEEEMIGVVRVVSKVS